MHNSQLSFNPSLNAWWNQIGISSQVLMTLELITIELLATYALTH